MTNFHIVYAEDHPILFGLSTLGYLGIFVEHPLVFIETVKMGPVHMIQRSDTQMREGTLQDLDRPLGVPKIEDMLHSTPASHPYQMDLQELERHTSQSVIFSGKYLSFKFSGFLISSSNKAEEGTSQF